MAIDKKLIHFNTKDTFDQKKDQIKDTSIVFVKDANMIYTHGEEYQFIEWGYLGTVGSDGEDGSLITFTVGNEQCRAEKGMTWEEFVNSEYNNTLNLTIINGVVLTLGGTSIQKDYTNVSPNDILINDMTYTTFDNDIPL